MFSSLAVRSRAFDGCGFGKGVYERQRCILSERSSLEFGRGPGSSYQRASFSDKTFLVALRLISDLQAALTHRLESQMFTMSVRENGLVLTQKRQVPHGQAAAHHFAQHATKERPWYQGLLQLGTETTHLWRFRVVNFELHSFLFAGCKASNRDFMQEEIA